MNRPSRSELIFALLETRGQGIAREGLDALTDKQLLRLYVETSRQRLNPTASTDFMEHGISNAEAESRAELFVERCNRADLERFAVMLVMSALHSDAMLKSQEELTDAYRRIPDAVVEAWGRERAKDKERKRANAKRGGDKAAAKIEAVRNRAIKLALERRPASGWSSAPAAAEAIYGDVREYARTLGRNFSRRAVEGWMRDAGIKRGA